MPKRAPSPQHIPPRKRPSLPFRPTFKSECIQAKDSTFQARLFSLDSPAPVSSILAYMRRQYPDFQHHMAAWRYLVLKPGMTGLEGDHAFEPEKGCEDDGESRGGKTILDVLERTGLSDVLVVVSRRSVQIFTLARSDLSQIWWHHARTRPVHTYCRLCPRSLHCHV